jgi:hypothetical protein
MLSSSGSLVIVIKLKTWYTLHETVVLSSYIYKNKVKICVFFGDLLLYVILGRSKLSIASTLLFRASAMLLLLIEEVKLSLCLSKRHAMKAYWGSEGIAPCIL